MAALNGASNAILRLLGVNPSAAFEEGGTPEDLKLLIAQSLDGGQLAPNEALMLSGVFELHEQQARQVMTPIPRVVTVDISEDAEAASGLCIKSGHTRLLVTEDSNLDRTKGIIHANSPARPGPLRRIQSEHRGRCAPSADRPGNQAARHAAR